jgi:hypothetical protein
MNKAFLVIITIVAGIALFAGGIFFSQVSAQTGQPGGMMGNFNGSAQHDPSMMGNGQHGPGMMGNGQSGMMDGGMKGMMMNGGMMGSYGNLNTAEPLTIDEVETAVTNYLATLNNDNLSLGEIMVFDNHAYAQIMDETSGIGAFEVLVDPVTQNVFPEPGPNMMWNTEYGVMSGDSNFGMMDGMMNGQFGSGMMGNSQYNSGMMSGSMMGTFGYAPDAEISITAEEAVNKAQEYLEAYLPGKTADETADVFPSYYTLHIREDGEVFGMLSVNAYTGQVFLHHWHGEFIEMTGEERG